MGLVTKNEKAILEAYKMDGTDKAVAALKLGKTDVAIRMSNTRLFKKFLEYLDIMVDYYPVFERRLGKNPDVYSKLRRLARQIRKE